MRYQGLEPQDFLQLFLIVFASQGLHKEIPDETQADNQRPGPGVYGAQGLKRHHIYYRVPCGEWQSEA
jgi:hypothetical protein